MGKSDIAERRREGAGEEPRRASGVASAVLEGARERTSDWGSLVADLAPPSSRQPAWHIHDRTHLEFAVTYPVGDAAWEWEAYFFIPSSLRVEQESYGKDDIYTDLRSYVRYAVPDVPFGALSDGPLGALAAAVERDDPDAVLREMRLFACQVRASGLQAKRAIADALLDGDDADRRSTALAAAARFAVDGPRVTGALREVLGGLDADPDLSVAARWIDEDVSRVVETLLGSLAVRLRKSGAPEKLRKSVIAAAVAEARYRRQSHLDGVGRVGATKREVEHLEFRRHVLKRFSSSVLWLEPRIREGAKWALQFLYALAAGVAMAFAVGAALLNGPQFDREHAVLWISIAIVAYMFKDRIKALLQSASGRWVRRRFPDRRWSVRDPERGREIGKVDEQSGFVRYEHLPADVLAKRLATRRHPIEERARPERVLRHKKTIRLRADRIDDERFDAVTEIFRLDLRRWLAHTDDPKRKILFADPDQGRITSAVAPRVYNLGVVYRLRRADDAAAPWRRIRVVVSRKGIRRIDHIEA